MSFLHTGDLGTGSVHYPIAKNSINLNSESFGLFSRCPREFIVLHQILPPYQIGTKDTNFIAHALFYNLFFCNFQKTFYRIIKAICVHGIRGLSLGNADVIAVLAKSLRFYSFDNQALNNEIDILEVVSEEVCFLYKFLIRKYMVTE